VGTQAKRPTERTSERTNIGRIVLETVMVHLLVGCCPSCNHDATGRM
jgi:hypothetical protein